MKKKGFTESQIILIIILIGMIILVLVPFLNNVIKKYKVDIELKKENKIITASKDWLNDIENKETIDGKTYYVSTNSLVEKKYLSKEILSGCVKIVYQENIKDYNYMYNATSCESIMSGKDLLISHTTTSGDGLYHSGDGYIYKGSNPNNYIKINSNLYRILLIDKNGIRLITNDVLDDRSWDTANIRLEEKNSYCVKSEHGCNAYVSNNSTVTQDSEINQYLETVYLNTIKTNDSLLNKNAIWNIGLIGNNFKVDEVYKKVSSNTISGNLGLLSIDDYIETSTNKDYTRDNWLNIGKKYWTITALDESNSEVWYINNNGTLGHTSASDKLGVRPVLNINTDKKLTGSGTQDDPYVINK